MNESVAFLPFHAINEFMRDDFRLNIIRNVLSENHKLSDGMLKQLNKQLNKSVKVPGFRNPTKAPIPIKLIPTIKAFEKNPDLVAVILSAWVELREQLRNEVYELLKVRGWALYSEKFEIKDILNDWRILPSDADRTRLPGFYTVWPKGEDFDTLYKAFMELFPDSESSIDAISLMAVWISMRLPYHVEEETNLEH